MITDLVSFALLLTLSIVAVIFVILAFERLWLMRKNSGTRPEKFRVGVSRF